MLSIVAVALPVVSVDVFASAAHAQSVQAAAAASAPASNQPQPTSFELAQASGAAAPTVEQLQQENDDLKARLERLEQLLDVKNADQTKVKANAQALKPLIPKNGFYIQGDIGGQYRDLAGENGYTVTAFQSGFYGSAGVGYRYNKNFRFSAEYANLSSNVGSVAACYQTPPSACGTNANDGVFFPGQGAIVLNQYTLNAYYDLDGFGYRKRFRPYVGLGVGTQKSSIIALSNTQAAPFGLYAYGDAWAPVVTFAGGISYVVSKNGEVYLGGKYSLGSELLFDNTAFGDLLPQSSRNWIVTGGFRYTF